jgi:phage terminase large subunit
MSNKLEINFKPNLKQYQMIQAFENEITTEILFGGAAGGSKSYGICAILLMNAMKFPGIRMGLARNELTTLKKTTVISLMEVATDWGIRHLYNYNSSSGIIKFDNGSEIVLCELRHLPSDPDFTRLGGLLFTFGVIDEVGEVSERGYSVFRSRLGRWKNTKFGVKPICIGTCNPIKNWLYRDFYKKDLEGSLEPYKLFIPALPTDNPYLPQSYLDNLATLPYIERERLLYGNWEYNDTDDALMNYENISNVWENLDPEPPKNETMYITADIAFTSDKMVIMVWRGLTIIKIDVNPKVDKIEDYILKLARDYKVRNSNIAYDSDGVGQFLKTRLSGAKPIVNNSKALKDENYDNLKTQLYYKLAEKVNSFEVKCEVNFNK